MLARRNRTIVGGSQAGRTITDAAVVRKSHLTRGASSMAGLYRGPIIDPHIHLWDLGMDRHLWLRPTGGAIQALGDLAPIRRNYLVDDYRRDAATQNVVATVHIEAAWDRAD